MFRFPTRFDLPKVARMRICTPSGVKVGRSDFEEASWASRRAGCRLQLKTYGSMSIGTDKSAKQLLPARASA